MENSKIRYDSTLIVVALSIIGFNVFLTPSIEKKVLFQAQKKIQTTPKENGLSFKEIYLQSKVGKIQTWTIDHPNSKRVALFFHGNSRNIGSFLQLYQHIYKTKSDLFIVEYPGYGKSEGTPTEENLYHTAETAYNYLIKQGYDPSNIFPIGYSLGGAVATQLASQKKVAALILISPMRSVSDTANSKLSVFSWLFWTQSKFNTSDMIKNVREPVIVLHSKKDQTIPYEHGKKVFKNANEPKLFLSADDLSHQEESKLFSMHSNQINKFVNLHVPF